MFVKTYRPWGWYFLCVLVFTLAAFMYFNPNREFFSLKQELLKDIPVKPVVFVNKVLDENKKNILNKNYRVRQLSGNEKRQAYHRVGFNFETAKLSQFDQISINSKGDSDITASPVVSLNYIVLASDDGYITVLNRLDYSQHWKLDVSPKRQGISATPVAFLDYAVVANSDGKVLLLDLKEKEVISTTQVGEAINASPLFDGEIFFFNVQSEGRRNFLIAMDLFNSKVKWLSDYFKAESKSSPVAGLDSVFFGDSSGNFYSILKASGKTNWVKNFGSSINESPTVFKDFVLLVTGEGELVCLKQDSGEELWRYAIKENGVGGLAVHRSSSTGILKSNKAMYKFNLDSGERISRLKLDVMAKSNPVVVENNEDLFIFTACREDQICMFKYKGLQLLKFFKLNAPLTNEIGVDTNKLILITRKDSPLFIIQ